MEEMATSTQRFSESLLKQETTTCRVVATKEQHAILCALHIRSRGRVTKEDLALVSQETGLDTKWIRKWLSRRRCRNKSTPAGSSSTSHTTRSMSPNLSVPTTSTAFTGYSPVIPLCNDFLAAPAFLSRPECGRSVSAPALSTSSQRIAQQFSQYASRPAKDPDHQAATAPPTLGYNLPVSSSVSRSGTVSPALLRSTSSSSLMSIDIERPLELAYPFSSGAATDEPLDTGNILNLIQCLQQVSGSPEVVGNLAGQSSCHLYMSAAQFNMFSALGLESAVPTPEEASILALESAGPAASIPPTQESYPVSFHVRLSDLLVASTPKKNPCDNPVRGLRNDVSPLVPELLTSSSSSSAPSDRNIKLSPRFSAAEESEDEDEVVTPGENNLSMILPGPRKELAPSVADIGVLEDEVL